MQISVETETYHTRSIIKLDGSRIRQFVFRNSPLICKTSKGELIGRRCQKVPGRVKASNGMFCKLKC